jgi:hypothetical protein
LRPACSRSPQGTLSIEGFDGFVASAAAPIATGWSDPFAGRVSHPLRTSADHGALWLVFLACTGTVISSEAAKAAESRILAGVVGVATPAQRDFSTRPGAPGLARNDRLFRPARNFGHTRGADFARITIEIKELAPMTQV